MISVNATVDDSRFVGNLGIDGAGDNGNAGVAGAPGGSSPGGALYEQVARILYDPGAVEEEICNLFAAFAR